MSKTYKDKKGAVRAAAKVLGVAAKVASVLELATLEKTEDGRWTWTRSLVKVGCWTEPQVETKPVVVKEEIPAEPTPEQTPVESIKKAVSEGDNFVEVNGQRFKVSEKDVTRMKEGRDSPSGFRFNRPKPGTKGNAVWAWADKYGCHAAVVAVAILHGHNATTVSGQYSDWIYRR